MGGRKGGGVFGLLGMDIFKLGDNKGENRQSFVVYSPPPPPSRIFFFATLRNTTLHACFDLDDANGCYELTAGKNAITMIE